MVESFGYSTNIFAKIRPPQCRSSHPFHNHDCSSSSRSSRIISATGRKIDPVSRVRLAVSSSSAPERPEEAHASHPLEVDASESVAPSFFPHHHIAIQTSNISTAILFYTSLFNFEVACKFRAGPARAAWLEQKSLSSSSLSSLAASNNGGNRLELIEVPPHLWPSPPPPQPETGPNGENGDSNCAPDAPLPRRRLAVDVTAFPTMLGYNHMALDVTEQVRLYSNSQKSSTNRTVGNDESNSSATGDVRRPHIALTEWMDHCLQAKSRALFNKTIRVAVAPRQQMIGRHIYELAFVYDADGCLIELLNHIGTLPSSQRIESGWEPWNGTDFTGE